MPSYKYLKVWGCLAKTSIPAPKRTKLGPKTVDCVFIGYALHSNACRFLVIDSKNILIEKNTIFETKDAEFFENKFPFKEKSAGPSSSLSVLPSIRKKPTKLEEAKIRRSKRPRTTTSFGPDFLTYLVKDDPSTFDGAISSPDSIFGKKL
ncbi:unnamed protein product [Fraxinus pennsylvanica]|uniref:Retroviral polymerase SH3-like domain-containing protein n=1 Tax=Fraxinus pennsylvanica TaxID=56036 RepID=A0AAD2A8U7_9LAMI|nr:unnamed protein product [Fraxinus pennsylvanica]